MGMDKGTKELMKKERILLLQKRLFSFEMDVAALIALGEEKEVAEKQKAIDAVNIAIAAVEEIEV